MEFEMMDKRFHAAGNLPLWRRRDLRIGDAIVSGGQAIDSLANDLEALFRLQHAYQIAIVHVAIRAYRNIEIKLVIAGIWKHFADIPGKTTATQDRSTGAIRDGLLFRKHRNAPGTFDPELIAREQIVILGDAPRQVCQHPSYQLLKLGGQIGLQATRTDIAGHHTHARDVLENVQNRLALTEAVQKHTLSTKIKRMCPQPEQVAGQALQFSQDDAGVLDLVIDLILDA